MTKNNLRDHHRAWLSAHPWRSEQWLRAMLMDGFDIHHLDGIHSNNDPQNLVLIEHSDHLMLHGGRTMGRLKRSPNSGGQADSAEDKAARKRERDIRRVMKRARCHREMAVQILNMKV